YGLTDKIPLLRPAISDTQMWALGPDLAASLNGATWHYSDPANPPAEKAMVKAYEAKYNRPPTVEVWQGWTSMRMLLLAMERAKSTDAKAVIQSLETLKITDGKIPLYYRSWDHRLIHPILLLRGKAPPANDKWDMLEVLDHTPSKIADIDKVFGSQAEIGCTLGDF
ncbi:MAG: ABC transporter substrate-binding protein, partial [Janthinobacterium lividum]